MVPVASAHSHGQQEEFAGGDRHVPEYTEAAATRDSGCERQLQEAERRVHRTRAAVSEGEAGNAERDEGPAIAHPVHQFGAGRVGRKLDGQPDRYVHGTGGDRGRTAKHESRTKVAGATPVEQRNSQDVNGEHAEQAARPDLVHGGDRAKVRDGEERNRRPVTKNAVRDTEIAVRERDAADLAISVQARAESSGGCDITSKATVDQNDSAVQAAEIQERGVRGETERHAGHRERK